MAIAALYPAWSVRASATLIPPISLADSGSRFTPWTGATPILERFELQAS